MRLGTPLSRYAKERSLAQSENIACARQSSFLGGTERR
jgi:hypothetical protein